MRKIKAKTVPSAVSNIRAKIYYGNDDIISIVIQKKRFPFIWKYAGMELHLDETNDCRCGRNPHTHPMVENYESWLPGTLNLRDRINEFFKEYFHHALKLNRIKNKIEEL